MLNTPETIFLAISSDDTSTAFTFIHYITFKLIDLISMYSFYTVYTFVGPDSLCLSVFLGSPFYNITRLLLIMTFTLWLIKSLNVICWILFSPLSPPLLAEWVHTSPKQKYYCARSKDLKVQFRNVFNNIPHVDKLFTDITMKISLKNSIKVIHSCSYSSPCKYKNA